jgi:defect in organelle trafficking protein DotB
MRDAQAHALRVINVTDVGPGDDEGFWPGESIRIGAPEMDALLTWAHATGASDIRISTHKPVWLQAHGRVRPVTRRSLTKGEVEEAVNRLYSADGVARLKQGQDFDVSYEIWPERKKRLRFRVNATAILARGSDGARIVMRTLPAEPPRLEGLGIEPHILEHFRVRKGFVFVSGGTENGKSTLLAAMMRGLVEEPNSHRSILTYEAPIEFVFDSVTGPSATIDQTEIPRHLPNFAAAARNAVRANPKAVLIGECRDSETMTVACQLSIAGCALYATIHAGSVFETVQRAVSMCPAGERASVAVQLAQSLRLIINQRLVPSTDGKRTALREFLVFDEDLRRRMLRAAPEDWPDIAEAALRTQGQSFGVAVERALSEGRISEDVAYGIRREFGDVA